jgi:glutamyl-tRNA reductase
MFEKIKERKLKRMLEEQEHFEKWKSSLEKKLSDYTNDLKNVKEESTIRLLQNEIEDVREMLEWINSTLDKK